jgi:hypothetical protein
MEYKSQLTQPGRIFDFIDDLERSASYYLPLEKNVSFKVDTKDQLKGIAKSATKLIQQLENLDSHTAFKVDLLLSPAQIRGGKKREQLLLDLKALLDSLDAEVRKDTRGRPTGPDASLIVLSVANTMRHYRLTPTQSNITTIIESILTTADIKTAARTAIDNSWQYVLEETALWEKGLPTMFDLDFDSDEQ